MTEAPAMTTPAPQLEKACTQQGGSRATEIKKKGMFFFLKNYFIVYSYLSFPEDKYLELQLLVLDKVPLQGAMK